MPILYHKKMTVGMLRRVQDEQRTAMKGDRGETKNRPLSPRAQRYMYTPFEGACNAMSHGNGFIL